MVNNSGTNEKKWQIKIMQYKSFQKLNDYFLLFSLKFVKFLALFLAPLLSDSKLISACFGYVPKFISFFKKVFSFLMTISETFPLNRTFTNQYEGGGLLKSSQPDQVEWPRTMNYYAYLYSTDSAFRFSLNNKKESYVWLLEYWF